MVLKASSEIEDVAVNESLMKHWDGHTRPTRQVLDGIRKHLPRRSILVMRAQCYNIMRKNTKKYYEADKK